MNAEVTHGGGALAGLILSIIESFKYLDKVSMLNFHYYLRTNTHIRYRNVDEGCTKANAYKHKLTSLMKCLPKWADCS